jgi:hypothetical protein
MPSTPSTKSHQSHTAEKLRQLYQTPEGVAGNVSGLIPFYCVEARIDFSDVRTGFRETMSLTKALEIYSDNADLLWTDDMIRDVDLRKTTSSIPDSVRLGVLPDFVDMGFLKRMEQQFIQYLLRSFEVKIFRNFDLNVYSISGESRLDFCKRCLELFDGPKRQELDRLHDVFNRKLEQTKQKYLSIIDPAELELAKSESRNRDAFSRCSERIAELFYRAELRVKPAAGPAPYSHGVQELDEKLFSLELEALHAINRLSDLYDEKARTIDEYILHPNLKDIHFVRSCILWISTGAA